MLLSPDVSATDASPAPASLAGSTPVDKYSASSAETSLLVLLLILLLLALLLLVLLLLCPALSEKYGVFYGIDCVRHK
jgi:uncharacterized membrane protein